MRNFGSLSIVVLVIMAFVLSLSVPTLANPYDFGGQTVTIYNRVTDLANFTGNRRFSEGAELAHKEWVEETFNVELEFVHPGNHDAWLEFVTTHVLEGERPAGLIIGQDQWMYIAAAQGLLYPLSDFLTEEYYNSLPEIVAKPLQRTNSLKGIPYSFQLGPIYPNEAQAVIWNKTLFENEGLPNLYDLVDAGEWTWDAMKDIAIRTTRDTTGDGEIDQWGVSVRVGGNNATGNLWQQAMKWVYTNDGALTRSVDGREVFALHEPQAVEAIDFWHELLELNVVGPAHWVGGFADGRLAMMLNNPGSTDVIMTQAVQEMADDWGIVPIPKGPRATDYVANERIRWTGMLPVTVENPEAKIALANALYRVTDEYTDIEQWHQDWYEGFALQVRDRESMDTIEWMVNNSGNVGYWEFLMKNTPLSSAITSVLLGEKGASSAMAELQPAAQAFIDEMFNE